MKKSILTLVLICNAILIFGQAWTSIGIKGGYGMNLLINKNLFDDNAYSHLIGNTYNYGAKVGLNIGDHSSITFDAMISNHKQRFEYQDPSNLSIEHMNDIYWNNLDLYLMYRNHNGGAYFELGPMLSTIRGVEQTDTGAGISRDTDVSTYYADKYLSGVLGVGTYIFGANNMTAMLGLRIHYAFQDFVSDNGKNAADFAFAFPNPTGPSTPSISTTPVSTNPLFVEFILEFNLGLGYFAKSGCSSRVTWFSGN